MKMCFQACYCDGLSDVPIDKITVALCDFKMHEQSVIVIQCLGCKSLSFPHWPVHMKITCMAFVCIFHQVVCNAKNRYFDWLITVWSSFRDFFPLYSHVYLNTENTFIKLHHTEYLRNKGWGVHGLVSECQQRWCTVSREVTYSGGGKWCTQQDWKVMHGPKWNIGVL